jgi:cytochrome P450
MSRARDPRDISSLAFWAQHPDQRDAVFAELRREAPVSWHPAAETNVVPDPNAPGFWAITRHADIQAVSKDAKVFSSSLELGGVLLEDIPADFLEATQSILVMDDPRHAKVRKVISSTFTPRRVALIEEQIRTQARLIIDAVQTESEIDFVSQVSARLPMWTISEMVGIAEADRERVTDAANAMVGWNDPEYVGDGDPISVLMNSMATLHGAAFGLVEARRESPADDLITALVQAEVDGARLTDEEIAAFFVLLCVAGNDTTRQTTSHAIKALHDYPEQRAALAADFDGRIGDAVEEFVRWASPVLTFKRTALADTEVGGQPIAEGERVVLFYRSGNFDETAFEDPLTFDITRTPNKHVGFGGGGPHFCLGSHLARTQLRALFSEIMHRMPDFAVGEPEYLAGNFINGIKRLPVTIKA